MVATLLVNTTALPVAVAVLLTAGGTTGPGSTGVFAGRGSGFAVGSIRNTLPPLCLRGKG